VDDDQSLVQWKAVLSSALEFDLDVGYSLSLVPDIPSTSSGIEESDIRDFMVTDEFTDFTIPEGDVNLLFRIVSKPK